MVTTHHLVIVKLADAYIVGARMGQLAIRATSEDSLPPGCQTELSRIDTAALPSVQYLRMFNGEWFFS